MTEVDRLILNEIQDNFPLSAQPYQDIASRIGIDESEVIYRIGELKDKGIIRRIGGILDSRSLGFFSTLCATRVPEDQLNKVGEKINQLPGVTHNYVRDFEWNMWFTLTTESKEEALSLIQALEQELQIQIKNMPAKKVYKIKVSFDMGE
ncbi:MAG: AsnC family transcriptional regulator [Bacillota bacterium]|nr:AsnC family transcriptional regulator [Bacillota bacterium]